MQRKIYGLLTLFLLSAVMVSAQKKVIHITSKIQVGATQPEVYTLLADLSKYPEWSPFLVKDPKQKNHVTGPVGQVGSTFHWEGVAEKSRGHQTLAELKDNNYLKYDCTIEKPFKGNPVFEYRLNKVGDSIEVVQDFNLHLTGFNHFMTKLFGVKKKMTAVNQLGLERFKAYIEKQSLAAAKNQ